MIPFAYKGLGALKASTLSNALMDNYPLILDHFGGSSLDLFAFTTTRTTISNQFDPAQDWPRPRAPDQHKDSYVFHNPVLHNPKDRRNILYQLRAHRFQVILVDPPFTPLQEK